MNKLVALLSLGLASSVFAATCKQDEAYFDATISKVERISSTSCLIQISSKHRILFDEHALCPLDLDEVLARGFTIKEDKDVFQGPTCGLEAGGTLAGVLVRKSGQSNIQFEQDVE